jgi:beta-aspartyl-peptidase (threonine type)
MSGEKEEAYLKKLNEALTLGSAILSKGGSSMDAVEAVIRFMEDCPLFNAGKGAVLDSDGKAELDASIMDGKTGLAGAVGGVTTIKNPVSAARLVMMKTPHVMLIGSGAERFAKEQGLEIVDPSYFITPERLDQWKKDKIKDHSQLGPRTSDRKEEQKHGTVGAVALDQQGNLAAATSTGGMGNKMAGRIGDSPIIGAGTYASNKTCAVSATGHGEFFIRNVVAYDLSALMEYRGMTLENAAGYLILEKLKEQKANGGLIALDRMGNIAMPFNTNAMFRGFVKSDGTRMVAIY